MEPIFTLVIALGGIATGIGAIWTALVTRHLARATEQILTEQGQSFAEQNRSLREQNERARLNLEVDLLYKLRERFDSTRFKNYRIRSLTYVKENYLVNGDILEVQYMDDDTMRIFEFFDDLGYLTRNGVVRIDPVLHFYRDEILFAWTLWETAVKKLREEWKVQQLFEDFEYLHRQLIKLDRQRGSTGIRPTKGDLRRFVQVELRGAGTGGEDPTKV
jgi:hypothetical protein